MLVANLEHKLAYVMIVSCLSLLVAVTSITSGIYKIQISMHQKYIRNLHYTSASFNISRQFVEEKQQPVHRK